jgi:hypothetical protein
MLLSRQIGDAHICGDKRGNSNSGKRSQDIVAIAAIFCVATRQAKLLFVDKILKSSCTKDAINAGIDKEVFAASKKYLAPNKN